MSGHTPGPWAILWPHDDWIGRRVGDWAVTVEDHDVWIVEGPTWEGECKEESRANARLIAAAPELLDALIPMTQGIHWLTAEHIAAARIAIAKATQP